MSKMLKASLLFILIASPAYAKDRGPNSNSNLTAPSSDSKQTQAASRKTTTTTTTTTKARRKPGLDPIQKIF